MIDSGNLGACWRDIAREAREDGPERRDPESITCGVNAKSKREERDPKAFATSTPSSFNWPATLTQIQSSDSSLGAMLTKFQHQLTGNTLTLIAPNKGVHKIVNNDKKRQFITEFLPTSIKLVIAEPGTAGANAAKDPTLAQISAIMGDVQEVTNGGESPF